MDAENLQNFVQYVLPTGRAALVGMIQEFKQAYGANWRKEFCEQNPDFSFFVNIVANFDAPAAFQELRLYASEMIDAAEASTFEKTILRGVANGILNGNYSNILETHRVLRAEIDKPRF